MLFFEMALVIKHYVQFVLKFCTHCKTRHKNIKAYFFRKSRKNPMGFHMKFCFDWISDLGDDGRARGHVYTILDKILGPRYYGVIRGAFGKFLAWSIISATN